MRNNTHFLFAIGVLNLYILVFIKDPSIAWLFLVLSFPLSGASLIPNLLDNYTAADLKYEGVQLKNRTRHPLTHSPWTLGYFFPFYYLIEKFSNPILLIFVLLLVLGWISHLFLDALNPEGIPLGRKPIYLPHLVKHYAWRERTNTRTFRFARIPFNDIRKNRLFSHIGLFLLALNLADLIYNHFQVISEVILLG